ncbi:MAG TPA: hypothetical protein VH138_13155 [Vicinamibacterales bacterium]|nr:hypothetical protein [Vicinamibacterales bacterium]
MNKHTRTLTGVVAGLLLVAAIVWLAADSDDRPPIIVTNGSMYFTNGDASSPIQPTQWTDDIVLSEWKPADNSYKGIKGFAVSFENSYATSVCPGATGTPPTTPLTGDEVRIEYTLGGSGGTITSTVRRRRSHLLGVFGKFEPKVVEPHDHKLKAVSPTQIDFEDLSGGYISKVSVAGTDCVFPAPPDQGSRTAFRVRMQPKADQ